ncbi:DUF6265 family protein [Massilia sp. R798]|uniref:DUF6265 family protein n=2 Tax=Massilia soli TaxID=2792854 RepID=A0ABS7SKT5_9BURK|nr:DUF6265 family protein [Massilia soli]MBZ2206800.1 DUF6265 family protein [Massilia soli]
MRALIAGVLTCAIGAAQAGPGTLAQLGWLQGCWRAAGAEAGSGEHWMAPAGGTMLGMSRTVKGGKTVAHEFLQIRDSEPGKLAFIAMPSGQPTASFAALELSGNHVVFENRAHDFPQRVIYRRDGDANLTARIEGTLNGTPKAIDFPMQRSGCGP